MPDTLVAIRIFIDKNDKNPRETWLRIGMILEEFGIFLSKYQLFVLDDNTEIEMKNEEVSWEAVYDCCAVQGREHVYAELDTKHSEWCDAQIFFGKLASEPWRISLVFSEATIDEGGKKFCDILMSMSKKLFVEVQGFVGAAAYVHPFFDYLTGALAQLCNERILYAIPQEEHAIWFYLLNEEIYKASKPYLEGLPIKCMEELPNGGAFLFVDYPIDFEDD